MKGAPARFTLQAPAKLNLFLHITGRRADGKHELQTLFQLLDYGDELIFQPAPPGHFGLHITPPPPSPSIIEDNLVSKAARLLQPLAGDDAPGVDIHLHKRLPYGAGLGGGSSDGAACLLGLRHLWGLHINDAELATLGLGLGADVPLFVRGHSAWGEGIGEQLRSLRLPRLWYLVITPDCQVSTAEIFAEPGLTRSSPRVTIGDLTNDMAADNLTAAHIAAIAEQTRNDCEAVTRLRHPQVGEVLDWLNRQVAPDEGTNGSAGSSAGSSMNKTATLIAPRMSGSGGSVFTAFSEQQAAEALLARLPKDGRASPPKA